MSDIVLHLQGSGDTVSTTLRPPIRLESDQYECALHSLDFYNSIPNITGANNLFRYISPGGTTTDIIIPVGAYEIAQLNDAIQRELIANGDSTADNPTFTLTGNASTFRSEIATTDTSFAIDFTAAGTFRDLLGFNSQVLSGSTFYTSDNVADIKAGTDVIRVFADITDGAFGNSGVAGSDSTEISTIYQTVRRVPPGFLQAETINNLMYFKLNRSVLSRITIRLVNQDGVPVGLDPREKSNFTIVIRRIRSVI